jgi:CheY-like chemotaxis protein
VIEEIVASSQKLLTRLLGEDVQLVTTLAGGTTVKIDPGQLEQIIMNLAVNARDAMPTGGKITIETAIVELTDAYAKAHWPAVPGRFAMLTVSDTGSGMDAETQSRIFEPFFTTKELGSGTGLGLATVYGIVKQSGGFIWVYSEPGDGATFKIYLPLVAESPSKEDRAALPQIPRGTETVLLLEDSPEVRVAVRESLKRYGYNVIEAASGHVAIDIATKHRGPIDLLLTDVVMPEMSGRAAAEKLATIRSEMKVLFMSGYTADAVVRHGVLSQGVAYLQKPFSPDALARRVREVLDIE